MLIRNDEEEDTPQGRDLNESYLSDYHEIDGVKIPFTVKQVHGHTTAIVHLTDVRVNQPIDDAVFSKPTQ